jgi:SAM-dependent methyltransferase
METIVQTNRFCPVCKKTSEKFVGAGSEQRKDAKCDKCGSLERHRLTWTYFEQKTNLFDGNPKQMLHVAPEICFTELLKTELGDGYITADQSNPKASVKMNITDIQYPDETFDVIYCSHVLEHVIDDRRAMREFHRVLKQDGWAILLVPVKRQTTFEDPSVIEPEDRLRVYGQHDHVRIYGLDYVDRLEESGFNVEITAPSDLLTPEKVEQYGLSLLPEDIYYCTKK